MRPALFLLVSLGLAAEACHRAPAEPLATADAGPVVAAIVDAALVETSLSDSASAAAPGSDSGPSPVVDFFCNDSYYGRRSQSTNELLALPTSRFLRTWPTPQRATAPATSTLPYRGRTYRSMERRRVGASTCCRQSTWRRAARTILSSGTSRAIGCSSACRARGRPVGSRWSAKMGWPAWERRARKMARARSLPRPRRRARCSRMAPSSTRRRRGFIIPRARAALGATAPRVRSGLPQDRRARPVRRALTGLPVSWASAVHGGARGPHAPRTPTAPSAFGATAKPTRAPGRASAS